MRVAIYYPWVYLKSGLERTLMEIKRRSRHDWTIVTSHYDADGTYPELKRMGVTQVGRVPVDRRYSAVFRAAATIFNLRLNPDEYDVLFVACEGLGSLINFRNKRKPVACLCFTPLRAVYDEPYRQRHLAQRPTFATPLALVSEWGYRMIDRLAWRHYDHVFCISECVKQRVLDGRLADTGKVSIAYPGIDDDQIQQSDTFEPFFFLPGRIMWTKNIELGIKAFRALSPEQRKDFRLIIAGMIDSKSQRYHRELLDLCANDPAIEIIDNPSDAVMRDLYRRCYSVLFTAFNEDLGLTPLEAMTCGKPTIAVNRGGPREIVAHDITGLLVDPEPAQFAEAMADLIADPKRVRSLGAACVERCRRFTWNAFVERLDEYVDRTCGKAESPERVVAADGKRGAKSYLS